MRGLVSGFTALLVLLAYTVCEASNTQWNCSLKLYAGAIGGSPGDRCAYLGVRPGATDGHDNNQDCPKAPPPMPPMVCVYWHRPTWDGVGTSYAGDWRAAIPAGSSKTWCDLRVESRGLTYPATLYLQWIIGTDAAWSPPTDYRFSIYDEGSFPLGSDIGCEGGFKTDMRAAPGGVSWSQDAEVVRSLHILVTHPIGLDPPTCAITFSPSDPGQDGEINFDSHASDPDGTIVSVLWDFGDGLTGSGLTASHRYVSSGDYTVRATASNDDGSATSCQARIMVNAGAECFDLVIENFEACNWPDSSWTVTGDPGWGVAHCMSHTGSASAWCAATGHDSECSVYKDRMEASMVYGPFDVPPDVCSATLKYWIWLDTEPESDRLSVEASTDGANFVGEEYLTGYNPDWRARSQDLSHWPGLGDLRGRQVWLRWRFTSDEVCTYRGVFVDDITVSVCRGVPTAEVSPSCLEFPINAGVAGLATLPQTGVRTALSQVTRPVLTAAKVGRRAIIGESIIGYDPRKKAVADAAVQDVGGTVVEVNPGLAHEVVRVAGDVDAFIEQVRRRPGVRYAEPVFRMDALSCADTPDDPLYPTQWPLALVNWPCVWQSCCALFSVPACSRPITVAVVDSGTDYTNSDLAAAYCELPGRDCVAEDDDPMPTVCGEMHGTYCSGILAATIGNGTLMTGVSAARLMSVRVLNGSTGTTTDAAEGIQWAADHGAKIINLSLGGPHSQVVADACRYAWDKGCLLVGACGNENASVCCPAHEPEVMAIGAVDSGGIRADWSSHGPELSLSAPGVGITSLDWCGTTLTDEGTSAACAHVAGVAALAWAIQPSLTNQMVRAILEQTAQDRGETGWDEYYGHGIVDACAAVQLASKAWRSARLDVCNRGGCPVEASITTSDASWLYVTPASFAVPARQCQTVIVWVPTSQAREGLLTITTNDPDHGTVIVPVTVTGHEIAVTAITASPARALPGEPVSFDITVANLGSEREGDLTLHVSVDGSKVCTRAVPAPPPGETAAVRCEKAWTPSACSSYAVAACADAVAGEADLRNNCLRQTLHINCAPACGIAVSSRSVYQGELVKVTVECADPESDPVISNFDWGDGSPRVSGPSATHSYMAGTYVMCATCTDDHGNSVTCCATVTVTVPPVSFNVKLAAIQTRSVIHLSHLNECFQRIRVRVMNQSADYDAKANVALYRWRFRTTGGLELVERWNNISIARHKSRTLTPECLYSYCCADRPEIKWKAVVTLLNGTDSDPADNTRYRRVRVR